MNEYKSFRFSFLLSSVDKNYHFEILTRLPVLGGCSPKACCVQAMNKECVEEIVLGGHLETLGQLVSFAFTRG